MLLLCSFNWFKNKIIMGQLGWYQSYIFYRSRWKTKICENDFTRTYPRSQSSITFFWTLSRSKARVPLHCWNLVYCRIRWGKRNPPTALHTWIIVHYCFPNRLTTSRRRKWRSTTRWKLKSSPNRPSRSSRKAKAKWKLILSRSKYSLSMTPFLKWWKISSTWTESRTPMTIR